MKRTLLTAIAVLGLVFTSFAQDDGGPTDEGAWLIEVNTGFGNEAAHGASTGFGRETNSAQRYPC